MKKWMLIPTIAAVACGILAALPGAWGQSGRTAGRAARASLKIAIVDVGQVLRHYKRAQELENEVNANSDASKAKINELSGKGKELVSTLQNGSLDPENPEYRKTATAVLQIESYLKSYKTTAQRELQTQGAQANLAVFNDLQDALKVFSENSGFTLILQVDREALSSQDPRVLGRISGQNVLFQQNCDDITSAVLAYLNRRYESSHSPSKSAEAPASASTPPTSSSSPARKHNR